MFSICLIYCSFLREKEKSIYDSHGEKMERLYTVNLVLMERVITTKYGQNCKNQICK